MFRFLPLLCLIGSATAANNRSTTKKPSVSSTTQSDMSPVPAPSVAIEETWKDYNISDYCIVLEARVRKPNKNKTGFNVSHLYGVFRGMNQPTLSESTRANKKSAEKLKYHNADDADYQEFSRQLQKYVYGDRQVNISALSPPHCDNDTIAWHVYNVTKVERYIQVSDRRLNHSEQYVDDELERLQLQYDLDSSTATPHPESDSAHMVIFTLEVMAVYLGLMLLLSISLGMAFAIHKHHRTAENAEAVQLERCYANLAKDSDERATVLEFISKEVNAAKMSTSRPASPSKPTVTSVDENDERVTPTATRSST